MAPIDHPTRGLERPILEPEEETRSVSRALFADGISKFRLVAIATLSAVHAIFWTIPVNTAAGVSLVLLGLLQLLVEGFTALFVFLLRTSGHAVKFLVVRLSRALKYTLAIALRIAKSPKWFWGAACVGAGCLAGGVWLWRSERAQSLLANDVALYGAAAFAGTLIAITGIITLLFLVRILYVGACALAFVVADSLSTLWGRLPTILRKGAVQALRLIFLLALLLISSALTAIVIWALPPDKRLPVITTIAAAGLAIAATIFLWKRLGERVLAWLAHLVWALSKLAGRANKSLRIVWARLIDARKALSSRLPFKAARNGDGWSINILSVDVLSYSKNVIAIFSVSIGSLATQAITILGVSFAAVSILTLTVFAISAPVRWVLNRSSTDVITIEEQPTEGEDLVASVADLPIGTENEPLSPPAESTSEAAYVAPPEELSTTPALIPIIDVATAYWLFDSADQFRAFTRDGEARSTISDLLAQDVCSLRLVIAYGTASSDGPRAYNEQLSHRRALTLAMLAASEAAKCAELEASQVVLAISLGQSLASAPDARQRRVELAGLDEQAIAQAGTDLLRDPQALLATAADLSGLPAPNEFSTIDVCIYAGDRTIPQGIPPC